MEPMRIHAAWATAALIAAVPLTFVIAPLFVEIAVRVRRRLGVAAALRGKGGR